MNGAPSGEQYAIASGAQRVTLVEVGGGIREYTSGGRHILDGYAEDEMCGGARGTPLVPWPNRIADGAYTFEGTGYQLGITEPERHNAIHGLLRWRNWTLRSQEPDRVVLGTVLHPEPGYPFLLDVAIDYSLREASAGSGAGLAVSTTATNLGPSACPYGAGQHPYLMAGTGPVDQATVRLDAGNWLATDERGLPTGQQPVDGTPLDFRAARRVGGTRLDHAYTDLARDRDGLAWVEVTSAEGDCDRLWADQGYRYIQLYSGDTQAADKRRRSLAVEPMTCPANSFRSGDGLLTLEPGRSITIRWGIHPG